MRTRLSLLLFLALLPVLPIFSQRGIINKGALIVVNNNAVINIQGGSAASYVCQTSGSFHGRMDLNGKLYLQGNWLNNTTGGTALINPGTNGEVILQGTSSQTIGGTQTSWFENLTMNNSFGASLLGTVNLSGNLGLTTGNITLGSYPLVLSATSTITGTPSASAMVIATGTGELRKKYSVAGSFLFPVGDNTSTAEYSPITLNFSSGTFGTDAYAGVRLVNSKHANNTSTTSYLNRYWVTNQSNISSFTCTPTLNYTNGDIVGTESNIYGGLYVSPFWTRLNAASTATNTISGSVNSLGIFTGGESSAFSVSFTMADDGLITEGSENGEIITITLFNSQFESSLNAANWSLTNAPQGITISSITRISNTQATLKLSGTRTKDYDSDITNLIVTIGHQELMNLDAGSVSAYSGVKFTAANDTESISMTDDGNITEGAIAGEKIYVTLNGGTFVSTLTPANWTLTNMPSGISIGSITRTGINTAQITLAGTAADFDTDITNTTLSVSEAEIDDYTGSNLTVNTGVRFIAIDESLVITMANDGNGITEGAENGEIITVTITNKTFTNPITPANWTLSNLPAGVTKGVVTRIDDTHVTIALVGIRTSDYDANITTTTLQIAAGEIVGHSSVANLSSGVIFTAVNDGETLAISGSATEGSENGAAVTVTLSGGTYASVLTPANWSLSNLPAGVSIGSVVRTSSTVATLTLSGSRTSDFDSNISLGLSVSETEIDDYTGSNLTPSSGTAIITATNDNETIAISSDGITEGAESGEIITVNLTGGTFVNTLTPANWVLTNLPAGVTRGSVSRISSTQVQITLSGNRTTDYDNNISNLALAINEAEIDDNTTGVSVSSGVVFTATDEAVSITLSTPVNITEGSENGKTILVTLSEDVFAASLSLASWSVSNLPSGISAGSITRTDNTHATITLSGNRNKDFDNNITNISVQLAGSQLTQHTSSPVAANTGVIINAIPDDESLSMSNDGTITEGAESGSTITVTLTGGTFASSLAPANWSISGQPTGVSIGSITRINSTTARITLSGNRTVDYDSDITSMQLSVNEAEIDDYTGANLTVNTGVTFTSILETLSLTITPNTIKEGEENGKILTVTLSGGTFVATLDLANWSVNGLPYGVSKGSISRISSTQVQLTLSGNRSADYDVNITNVTVTCASNEIVAYGGGSITSGTGLTLDANVEQLSVSHSGLTEINLHNAVIQLLLTEDKFVDNSLNVANFSLVNAPAGTGISQVSYTDATHASLTITYDSANYDFDNNITNFRIAVADEELDGVGSLASNALTITAIVETISLVAGSSVELNENNLDGKIISLQLYNETFADNILNSSNFSLLNAPAGLTISSVQWISNTSANVYLSFNGTDFDSDYNNLKVQIAAVELFGNNAVASNSLSIKAQVEIPSVLLDAGIVLTEENLNNALINLELTNETFKSSVLNVLNYQLIGAPAGLSVIAISWNSSTSATIQLAFNGTDFDEDIPAVSVSIAAAELTGNVTLVSSNSFSIDAIIEPPLATIAAVGLLDESSLDGGLIEMELTNTLFADDSLLTGWFTLNDAPEGVSIDTVYFQSYSTAILRFAYNQTDFDLDAVISITIHQDALESFQGSSLTSNNLLIPAVIEENNVTISSLTPLDESILNGATLSLVLVSDTFSSTPDLSSLTLTGSSLGLSISAIEYISSVELKLRLEFRGDIDYDIDFSVSVAGSVLEGNRNIISNSLSVTAIVEPVSVVISHPGLTENNLDDAEIGIELTNTSFINGVLEVSSFTLNNAPVGCQIDSVQYADATHALVFLSFDGTDFDTDITDFNIQISGTEFNDATSQISNNLTITATAEPELTIAHPGLTESNLDGAELTLTLNNAEFSGATLVGSLFQLNDGPPGLTVDSVIVVNNQVIRLLLAFDHTDFQVNYPNFSVSVDPSVTGLTNWLQSNTLTITFVTGVENPEHVGIKVYGYKKSIYVNCNKADDLEGYVTVYNIAGQAVKTQTLEQKNVNVLLMYGPDNSYIVRIFSNKGYVTEKVVLIGE